MSSLRLLLLGPPQTEVDGAPVQFDTRKATALLAYLAITAQAHRREALATLLWPEYDQERAYANLRRTLWSLNKALGKEWLDADQDSVNLRRPESLWLDVDAFHAHLAECQSHGHPRSEACSDCVPPLTAAVELYRGDLMAGFTLRDSPAFDEWQFFQTESLREEQAGALEALVRCHTARQEFELAIGHARQRLALDPLHEPAHRALMKLYAWHGQRAAALRQYRECVRILEEELGVPPQDETTQLYEAIRSNQLAPAPQEAALATEKPVRVTPPTERRQNLPAQPTSFVGREEELAEIASLLSEPDARLVSLVGLGGVGKTRLAVQAALGQIDAFSHGVYFVPLGPLSSPEFIVPTIADVLGFSFYQREGLDPKQQLLNFLRAKQMLLVMDNFEHLVGGAGLLTEVLAIAPGVRILVTSRHRLNLQGEWVLPVSGLRFPMNGDTGRLEDHSAVQLFLRRAGQADASGRLTEEDMPCVIRICQLVEGMPLAIELAAAWLKVLSCREIAAEIERGLGFLTTQVQDLPERHRSLRAVFDHSWELLSAAEAAAFRRLSVFRGGFTREAATQVAGADLAILSALVDKSLVHRHESGRYEVHELLRQRAAERLQEQTGEANAARDRHSSHFLSFLERRTTALKGGGQRQALDEIAAEIDNVRDAWSWAVAHRRAAEMRRAAEALFRFYLTRSLFQEGRQAFARAVQALQGEDSAALRDAPEVGIALGVALALEGRLADALYEDHRAKELLESGLEMLNRFGARQELALVQLLAVSTYGWDDLARSERWIRESLAVSEALSDRSSVAWGLLELSEVTFDARRADYSELKAQLLNSLAIFKEVGDQAGAAACLFRLGQVAQHMQGDRQEARQRYQESVEISREIGDRWRTSIALDFLGYVVREMGEYEQARQAHEESLSISEDIGDLGGVGGSIDNLGLVARDLGEYDRAAELLQQGLASRQQAGHRFSIANSLWHLGDVALIFAKYEDAAQRYLQSLELCEEFGWAEGIASCRRGLGEVAIASGDVELAWKHFREGLQALKREGVVSVAPDILISIAKLRAQANDDEGAVDLLAFVWQHPASTYQARESAGRLLAEYDSRLSPEAAADAKARSRDWDLSEVIDGVL